MEIKNQVVLVTGASRGLGTEIAKAFGREGDSVIVNYHQNRQKAQQIVAQIGNRAIAIQADVTDSEQVLQLFSKAEKHFGQPVSTVVNNALIDFTFDPVKRKNTKQITWSDYQVQLEGSVKASLNTTQAGIEGMSSLKFGRIITIGTSLVQNPVVPYHDYNTSKAALIGFTRTMARELGEYSITVNMVSGGLLQKTDASSATSDEVFDLIRESTSLN